MSHDRGTNQGISIHAPRVGSDHHHRPPILFAWDFNPRSPCGERLQSRAVGVQRSLFQSTLPVWGATSRQMHRTQHCLISIHAPRVGSDPDRQERDRAQRRISIHAPRVGSDTLPPRSYARWGYFNPRSPCGERLFHSSCIFVPSYFNPRSPCGERPVIPGIMNELYNFNPRSPCGERLAQGLVCGTKHTEFQSTLPVRGATCSGL